MSSKEELLIAELEKKCAGKLEDFIVKKPRRVYCNVAGDNPGNDIFDIVKILKESLDITYLCTITGIDTGEGKIDVLYHFSDDKTGILLTITLTLPMENLKLKSITPVIPGAIWYEKELIDMLGIEMIDMPEREGRYPLQDDFPTDQHPLLKSWKSDTYIKQEDEKLCQK
ncbi:NADH-quinone oxidoreductase subunit C [Parelusimicrobium proximum]|uniref:NADH-quinone oxidoreductase subunit C n=1 Tax=Parelusimicrobium proximum TaxID=3228953 RepID=UPI003D180D6D